MSSATRRLLDRARGRLTVAELERLVGPSDPGWYGYLTAMRAVLEEGAVALVRSRYIDGDLDFDEPIDCAQWERVPDNDAGGFRWFRLMCSAAALLLEHRAIDGNENYFLATILSDSLALGEPTELAAEICRETRARSHPWDGVYAFTFLGELLVAPVDRLERLAAEFEAMERQLCAEGHYKTSEYLWGTTFFDQLHPVWLELVRARLPDEPASVARIKRALLEHGARWRRG